jgi:hypothetical protein
MRARLGVLFCVVGLFAAGLGCQATEEAADEPSPGCRQMLAHAIDLQLRGQAPAEPSADWQEELEKHRASLEAAIGPRFYASCRGRDSKRQVECVLAATSGAELAACHGG